MWYIYLVLCLLLYITSSSGTLITTTSTSFNSTNSTTSTSSTTSTWLISSTSTPDTADSRCIPTYSYISFTCNTCIYHPNFCSYIYIDKCNKFNHTLLTIYDSNDNLCRHKILDKYSLYNNNFYSCKKYNVNHNNNNSSIYLKYWRNENQSQFQYCTKEDVIYPVKPNNNNIIPSNNPKIDTSRIDNDGIIQNNISGILSFYELLIIVVAVSIVASLLCICMNKDVSSCKIHYSKNNFEDYRKYSWSWADSDEFGYLQYGSPPASSIFSMEEEEDNMGNLKRNLHNSGIYENISDKKNNSPGNSNNNNGQQNKKFSPSNGCYSANFRKLRKSYYEKKNYSNDEVGPLYTR